MVELIEHLDASDVRANLALVNERLAAAGRTPGEVQILAAVKYLPADQLSTLAQGGITLAGENRASDLATKAPAHPELTWISSGRSRAAGSRPSFRTCATSTRSRVSPR